MKKAILIASCLLMALSMTGCGAAQKEPVTETQETDDWEKHSDEQEPAYDPSNSETSDDEGMSALEELAKAEDEMAAMGIKASSGTLRKIDPSKVSDVFTVPDGITIIAPNAFTDIPVKEVILPESVTMVSPFAFADCKTLERIVVPKSVTNVGDAAFMGCSSLKSLTIENKNCGVGSRIVSGCASLEECITPKDQELAIHVWEHTDTNGNDIDTSSWNNDICIHCGLIKPKEAE